jgi:hypothetical protein
MEWHDSSVASGDALALAGSVVALGGAAVAGSRYVSAVYSRTLGSRRALQYALHQIGPGVTTGHIEGLLGPAVYSRRAQVLNDPPTLLDQSFESIYFTPHAYVQIIHDEHGEVLAFGVTSIDPDFHPTLRQVPRIASGDVYIGRTHFGELSAGPHNLLIPDRVWLHKGPYRAHYNEVYDLGRSGRYLIFAFAWNESGAGSIALDYTAEIGTINELSGADWNELPDAKKQEFDRFRAGTTINTICVYADRAASAVLHELNPWRYGLDSESTPDLLEKHRGPIRHLRDDLQRIIYRRRR